MSSKLRSLALAATMLVFPSLSGAPVLAQQAPGYFIPPGGGQGGGGQGGGGQGAQPARPQQAPRPQSRPVPAQPLQQPGSMIQQQQQQQEPEPPPLQVQLPPVPDLPPLARGTAPPAAVVGVLGIPDIMRTSTAAQQIEKTVGERREKLNQDAQKEQAAWRDLQQTLANQRASLNADQIRGKERELQERITNAQKTFRDRNRIIQETGQYGLAQIERMLIAVIRQVAESRGMNLVLHRPQVALNINEFDVTEQVVEQLNKVLPTVTLPPDGVSPSTFAPPLAAASPAPQPVVPASAPPASAPPASAPPASAPPAGSPPATTPTRR